MTTSTMTNNTNTDEIYFPKGLVFEMDLWDGHGMTTCITTNTGTWNEAEDMVEVEILANGSTLTVDGFMLDGECWRSAGNIFIVSVPGC